jgi:hypothetical protein
MKEIRGIPRIHLVRLLYFSILVAHLLMLALGGNAQSLEPAPGVNAGPSAYLPDSRINRVKQIYSSQIGVREKQPNSGVEVEKYLRYVNLPQGNPWCAAFVCWTLGQAGVANPRTGWSPSLFSKSKIIWSKGESSLFNGQKKKPGRADIFGLYFPEKGRIAHVGFVDEWQDPWVVTVEGNTNVLGSREGDGVYRKRRLVRSVYQVARHTD